MVGIYLSLEASSYLSLEGRTFYLVDLQWGMPEATDSVFQEMQDWFTIPPSFLLEVLIKW